MIDTDTFVKLVKAMRAAQKAFYKSEKGSAERTRYYDESRSLERQVDKAIPEMEDKQLKLFAEEGN